MGMERLHLITHFCCQVSTMCQLWYPKHQAVVGREGHEEVTAAPESSGSAEGLCGRLSLALFSC